MRPKVFHNAANVLFISSCADVGTTGAKAMMGETAGTVAGVETTAPPCTSCHYCLPHTCIHSRSNSLKDILDEAVRITIFIKFRPLSMAF